MMLSYFDSLELRKHRLNVFHAFQYYSTFDIVTATADNLVMEWLTMALIILFVPGYLGCDHLLVYGFVPINIFPSI